MHEIRGLICRFTGVLVLSVVLGAGPVAAQDALPTNVVFILSDDHRYDFMGFHPNAPDFLETPAMDRMAREGVHIANAFVSTSLCSPSRASILTGQYAHRHGVVDNQRAVPEGTHFFPEYLQQAGYETAYVGKWHMGHENDDPRPGFTRWVSYRGQGTYFDPVLNVDGERIEHEGYTADIVTDYALDWLEEKRADGDPFFLYLSHKSVHGGFQPAPRHEGRYADVDLDYPETMYLDAEGRETWPDWIKEQRSSWHGVDYMYHGRLDYNKFYRDYAETLLGLDESIGRVLDYLTESGLAENTIVFYMGDNGFSFGEHGLIDKRHALEESMRVPMLAWAPGHVEAGSRIQEQIVNIDVMPTILELAGSRPPALHVMDGRSFAPLLEGDDIPWRDDIFYEYYWEWNFPQTPTQFALRTPQYKYVFFYGIWDDDALFDMQNDPKEQFNLINDEAHQEVVEEMRTALFERLRTTDGTQIPLREPKGGRNADQRPTGVPTTDPLLDEGR